MESVEMDLVTILIVDDEESVRQTFHDWLKNGNLGCQVFLAYDAASALKLADQQQIDLAILDWNLGAGHDGLRLLQELSVFQPNLSAIMVTGFSGQATPLMAMRIGVRDFLDKNQDLDRNSFLRSVNRQLQLIRPAKREKIIFEKLRDFRDSLEKLLPFIGTTRILSEKNSLGSAVQQLLSFLLKCTDAKDGVVIVNKHGDESTPEDSYQVFDIRGNQLNQVRFPFSRSLASTVISFDEPVSMVELDKQATNGRFELETFEKGRSNLLAASINVLPASHIVIELFDKPDTNGFSIRDKAILKMGLKVARDLLEHHLVERSIKNMLFDAVSTALNSDNLTKKSSISEQHPSLDDFSIPHSILTHLENFVEMSDEFDSNGSTFLPLIQAIRELGKKHGSIAIQYCTSLIQNLNRLLDERTGLNGGISN